MDAYLKQLFDSQVAAIVDDNGQVIIGTLSTAPLEILEADPTAYQESFLQWQTDRKGELLLQAERILKIGDNSRFFLGLQKFLKDGSVVPFIGAGMSAPSGFPLWGVLMTEMCNDAGIWDEGFAQMVRIGAYDDAVQRIMDARGKPWIWNKILHKYQSYESEGIEGSINYIPHLFKQGVVTTNFDNALEKCFAEQGIGLSPVCTRVSPESVVDLLNQGVNFLYKPHGTYDDPSSRVLARSEYDAAYTAPEFVATMQHLFTTKKVLFLGCSLATDRTMQFLFDLIQTHPLMGPHYAFLAAPKGEWEKRTKETFLAARGINPIWYDGDHDACLTALLEKLMN